MSIFPKRISTSSTSYMTTRDEELLFFQTCRLGPHVTTEVNFDQAREQYPNRILTFESPDQRVQMHIEVLNALGSV